MSNEISDALKEQLFLNESTDPVLELLTLSHPSFANPIYLVSNTEDIISNGNTFVAFPMRIVLPEDNSETDKRIRISFDNISRFLIDSLRSITDPIDITYQIVLASNPNIIEIEITDLQLRNITSNVNTIEGTLALDDFLRTELSSEKYTPSNFPGLFS